MYIPKTTENLACGSETAGEYVQEKAGEYDATWRLLTLDAANPPSDVNWERREKQNNK